MTLIVLLANAALIGLLAAVRVGHDKRVDRLINLLTTERAAADHQRIQPNPDTQALIALVQEMAQRIQAPDAAVVAHDLNNITPPPPVQFDNDNAYWEGQPVSKETLAEALMTAETYG